MFETGFRCIEVIRMARKAVLFMLVALAGLNCACRVGMTARKYPPALGPNGVLMRVRTGQGPLSGELIEVRDFGIVLADQKLHLVLYRDILWSEVEKTSSRYALANGAAPTPDAREHLRLLSRFPYGLKPELMQQLLRAYSQTELAGPMP